MMKRTLAILLMLPALCFAQDEVLQKFFQNLENKTLEAAFTVTVTEKATQPTSLTGNIVMRGEKFKGELMGTELAYDGTTLYTYNEDMDELTLSSPTMEELTESNPLLFARSIAESCTTETKEQGGNYVITLLPDNKSAGVSSFTLVVRKADLLPLSATMREGGARSTAITFRQAGFTNATKDFSIQKTDAYINDLR